MSAAASAGDAPLAPTTRPGLGRLTRVELRKMTDTRAGFWLQASVVALTLASVALLVILATAPDRTLHRTLEVAIQPAGVLLPIVGILLVSSEWTQRTALITFTLVPARGRVLLAKLGAGVALALIAVVLCVLLTLAAVAIGGRHTEGTWSLPPWLLGQVTLSLATSMVIGIGFGAVLLRSAPAIVCYFLIPIAWAALGAIPPLADAARWLDPSRSLAPLTDHALGATEWARAGTSLALWMLLPVLAGWWRISRSDVQAA